MIQLTPELRAEYVSLWRSMQIEATRRPIAERVASSILGAQERYEAAGGPIGVPWWFVGCVHQLECGGDFRAHLHNGDPLTARTRRVPAGRPLSGGPPFLWHESAQDALRLRKLDRWNDWTLTGALYQAEGYNGFGYRLRRTGVNSPYLWSFSNHYAAGKFVTDGKFDRFAVSKQVGFVALMRILLDKRAFKLEER